MLVRKKIAYAFDEILGGSFERVLVLMAEGGEGEGGGGGAQECRIVVGGVADLGGVLVASDTVVGLVLEVLMGAVGCCRWFHRGSKMLSRVSGEETEVP